MMEFYTAIDPAALADSLHACMQEDAATHKRGGFEVIAVREQTATIAVHQALHPQNNLLADITWEACEGGSHVAVSYRKPTSEEAEPVGVLAPIAARATVALIGGAVTWGITFGLCRLIFKNHANAAWIYACIPVVVMLIVYIVRISCARVCTRRRFEKLLKNLF